MTRDFGGRVRPVWRRGQRLAFARHVGGQVALAIGFLIFASLPTFVAISPIGPNPTPEKKRPFKARPCEPIGEAAFTRGWAQDPHTFSFLGTTFARRRGDADCQGRKGFFDKDYWPVCEFDVPFQLAVTRGGRTLYYAVPAGYTAIVEARPQAPTRCFVTELNTMPLQLSGEPRQP